MSNEDPTQKPSRASQPKRQRNSTNSNPSISGPIKSFTFMPPVDLSELHPGSTPPQFSGSSVTPTSVGITRVSSSQPRTSKRTHSSSSSAPVEVLPPISYVTGSAANGEATFATTYPLLVMRTALATSSSSNLSVLSDAADHAKKVSVLGGSSHRSQVGCTGLGTVSIGHSSAQAFQRDTRLLRAVIDGDIGRIYQLINAGVNLYEKYPNGTVLDYAINNTIKLHKKDDIISAIFLAGFNVFSTVVTQSILEEIAHRATYNSNMQADVYGDKKYMPMPFGYDRIGNKILEGAAQGTSFSRSTFAEYPRPAMQRWLDAPIEVRDPQIPENMARIALDCQAGWRLQDAFKLEVIIQSHVSSTPPLLRSRQDTWSPLLMRAPYSGGSSLSDLRLSSALSDHNSDKPAVFRRP